MYSKHDMRTIKLQRKSKITTKQLRNIANKAQQFVIFLQLSTMGIHICKKICLKIYLQQYYYQVNQHKCVHNLIYILITECFFYLQSLWKYKKTKLTIKFTLVLQTFKLFKKYVCTPVANVNRRKRIANIKRLQVDFFCLKFYNNNTYTLYITINSRNNLKPILWMHICC